MQPYPPDPDPKKPEVCGASVTISQDPDSCSNGLQVLTLESDDAGGGHFYVLRIDGRWAFDTMDEFIETLRKLDDRLAKCGERIG